MEELNVEQKIRLSIFQALAINKVPTGTMLMEIPALANLIIGPKPVEPVEPDPVTEPEVPAEEGRPAA